MTHAYVSEGLVLLLAGLSLGALISLCVALGSREAALDGMYRD